MNLIQLVLFGRISQNYQKEPNVTNNVFTKHNPEAYQQRSELKRRRYSAYLLWTYPRFLSHFKFTYIFNNWYTMRCLSPMFLDGFFIVSIKNLCRGISCSNSNLLFFHINFYDIDNIINFAVFYHPR